MDIPTYEFIGSITEYRYQFKSISIEKEVVKIVADFLHQNPHWFVFIQGSDDRRKRLYQILMNRENERLVQTYVIWSVKEAHTEIFEKIKTSSFLLSQNDNSMEKMQEPTAAQLIYEYEIVDKKLVQARETLKKFPPNHFKKLKEEALKTSK